MMDHHQSQRKANGGVNVDRVNQLILKKEYYLLQTKISDGSNYVRSFEAKNSVFEFDNQQMNMFEFI